MGTFWLAKMFGTLAGLAGFILNYRGTSLYNYSGHYWGTILFLSFIEGWPYLRGCGTQQSGLIEGWPYLRGCGTQQSGLIEGWPYLRG